MTRLFGGYFNKKHPNDPYLKSGETLAELQRRGVVINPVDAVPYDIPASTATETIPLIDSTDQREEVDIGRSPVSIPPPEASLHDVYQPTGETEPEEVHPQPTSAPVSAPSEAVLPTAPGMIPDEPRALLAALQRHLRPGGTWGLFIDQDGEPTAAPPLRLLRGRPVVQIVWEEPE
jgi:hypothetical protein